MLAQVALIAFGLLGVLSLAIDMGLVRLTQAQMQNAADGAALEGLRQRDIGVLNPATNQFEANAFAADCLRRTAAHRLARSVFDEDLDPATFDTTYGAGPLIDLTEGVTSMHALQTISVPAARVYKPVLQLNQQNADYGDMVSGRFCYNPDPAPSEGFSYALPGMEVCTEPQRASGGYARNDFNPNSSAPEPPTEVAQCPAPDDAPPDPWPFPSSGSLTTVDDSAFLVRLRRSNELREYAGQVEPEVASSGPSIPLLFGRGTVIHGDNPELPYSIRRDGLTVRATAIAGVRPAMQVGLPDAARGVTPFALLDTFVATLGANPQTNPQLTINPQTGVICTGTTCGGGIPATAVGRFVTDRASINTVGLPLPLTPSPLGATCPGALPQSGYGPVFSLMASSGVLRVIGFARTGLIRDASRPTDPCAARVSRGMPLVADVNATATLTAGLPLPPETSPEEVRELLDKHFEREGRVVYGALLAPALVR